MRLNNKELAAIARKPSQEFDMEGILYLKEKEGSIFKSESYSEKLFRLKGNLLFYFKTKDKTSDLAGIVVLERVKVGTNSSEKDFGFYLDFEEEDEQKYELAAKTWDEMNHWVEAINGASYEQLRVKLVELRSEIMSKTGQDPLPGRHPIVEQNPTPSCRVSLYSPVLDEREDSASLVPVIELCVGCTDLVSPCEGAKPAAFIKVYGMTPPAVKWTKLAQTEVAEEGSNPDFLTTIVLYGDVEDVTRLKFVVFDVRSKSKQDVLLLGQAVCMVKDIEGACESKHSLTLMNVDSTGAVGKMHLYGWKRGKSGSQIHRQSSIEFLGSESTTLYGEKSVRTYITNTVQRNFRFPTNKGEDLKVQEFMGESLLCYRIPMQIIGLFIKEEKEAVVELHNLGHLHREWDHLKEQLQNSHFDLVHQYSSTLAELSQYGAETCFKKSSEKQEPELEFISTNLHLQRTRVVEPTGTDFIYDIVTTGAPTAYPHKYRHGGLKRMLASAAETTRRMTLSPGDTEKTKAGIKARTTKVALRKLEKAIKSIADSLLSTEPQSSSFENIAKDLSDKVGELLNAQDSTFMSDVEMSLMRARLVGPFHNNRSSNSSQSGDVGSLDDGQWLWNGNEFRRSLVVVRDMDCGVRNTTATLMATVHNVMNGSGEQQEEHRKALVEDVKALVSSCESLIRKLVVSMRFILMQEEVSAVSTFKELRYRRDVVFSQALTPVVAGFLVKLSQNIKDLVFLGQLSKVGLLVHLESLLTPHGDEMGMLEDTVIAMKDLQKVQFKFVCSDSEDSFPVVCGGRYAVVVEIPLPRSTFSQLPETLRENSTISICPVMFTVGINEHATLAERFGDMSLQDEINATSLATLRNYYLKFDQYFPDWRGYHSEQQFSLPMLLTHLQTLIQSKKSKNYEILLVSEEICWRLNAVRMTSCKSAKDRSSMAVTLEVAKLLEREHDMREDALHKVLATLRSQGTRLMNVHKNIGMAKYAFNMMQVKALPSDYRPPEGTYGKNLQT